MTPLQSLRQRSPRRLAVVVVAAVAVLGLAAWVGTLLWPSGPRSPQGSGEPRVSWQPGDPSATPTPGTTEGTPGTPEATTAPGSTQGTGGQHTPPANDAAVAAMEAQVITLVNAERADEGCSAMTLDSRLATAARAHALDMATRDYFSHNTPEGVTFDQRITNAGYRWSGAAENIALGQPTAQSVMRAWMDSPDHRANILNCGLRHIGVGLAYDATDRPYWAQSLASPA